MRTSSHSWVVRSIALATLCGATGCGATRTDSPASPRAAGAPVDTAEIVAVYPHDVGAFTQGLELHDGVLYESTGLLGRSSLRIVERETGRVVRQRDVSDAYYAEGLTLLDGSIYQLTFRSGVCFVYDAETLAVTREHAYPGEGWGLTHHDGALWMSDGTPELRVLDPATFEERRRVTVRDEHGPVEDLNELEMVEGELYANVWMSDRIARIDPETGRVLGWIDLAFLRASLQLTEEQAVLNGIAYDAEHRRLFVTGKLWPKLFEIRVVRR